MTELSIQYACSPTTGDYGPVTVENLAELNLFLGNINNQNGGVIYWTDSTRVPRISTSLISALSNPVDGLLEPTENGGIVSIDTGVALVNGYLYFNDVVRDFPIDSSPGNANATDLIVLRWEEASQSVRLARKLGAAASTATVTQSGIVWEIALAEVVLDGAGQFSSLNDVRQNAIATLAVGLKKKFVQAMSGFEDSGGTALDMFNAGEQIFGAQMPDANDSYAGTTFIIPHDFISDLSIAAVVMSLSSGNVRVALNVSGGGCGESVGHIVDSGAAATVAITASETECVLERAIAGVEREDVLTIALNRQGTNGADTLADDLVCLGFSFEYFGYNGNFPN